MPKPAVSHKHLASEIARCLEDNELEEFRDQIGAAGEVGYDLNFQYGSEVGFKTILHLAIDEEEYDTTEYIEILLKGGASAKYVNTQLRSAPIHVAANEGRLAPITLLLKYPDNKADVNALDKNGLNCLHILLVQLLEAALVQNKPQDTRPEKLDDGQLEKNILDLLDAIILIAKQKELAINFNDTISLSNEKLLLKSSYKKLTNMTPLQILCSFQTWNARPISIALHRKLAEAVSTFLKKGADPNAAGAKNAVAGSVAGSTPPVLLAAIRGYYLVVEIFKTLFNTDFLIENKFQQNILHIVLKAGYYNKILVHGDESGAVCEKTIYTLLEDNNNFVKYAMKSVINRVDSYGNSPLHYAKHYPNQEITKFLLRNGAKVDRNPQGSVNVMPRTIEEFFFEDCMETSGEDVDDEEFSITIQFNIFAQSDVVTDLPMQKVQQKAQAWSAEVEQGLDKGEKRNKRRKVDTKRLEHFADVDNFRYLLKHPVLSSFLEMELNNLKRGYILDFMVYLLFVLVLFIFLGERFVRLKNSFNTSVEVYYLQEAEYSVTVSTLIILTILLILVIREFYQLIKLKRRYFHYYENMIEWTVILLVLFSLLPNKWFQTNKYIQKHIAAFTFLLAFMQLYLLLVRIVPNTPIPLYINMFTTVLKTYTFILLSYFAFIASFAFSFSIVFSNDTEKKRVGKNSTISNVEEEEEEFDYFGSMGLSLVKTIVMFAGEMDYTDIPIKHWLGYVLFLLFVFLMVVVLMNLLNGLAVSDIHKIQKEVDTYYHISIVETLAYSKFVTLLAEKITIQPNIKPESQKLLGINIPGAKRYQVLADGKTYFYLNEGTVKAAKDLIVDRQAQTRDMGQKVTMEELGVNMESLKKEQTAIKSRLGTIEDSVSLMLDIMKNRGAPVERY